MPDEVAQSVGLDDYRQPFFGEPWPSGVCDGGIQVPTPLGKLCLGCDEPVVAGDQGTLTPFMALGEDKKSLVPDVRPYHRECMMRATLGSIGHLRKTCSCYGGEGHDEPGKTRRESAIQVWGWIMEHGI